MNTTNARRCKERRALVGSSMRRAGVSQIPDDAHRSMQRGYDPMNEAACNAAIALACEQLREKRPIKPADPVEITVIPTAFLLGR